MFDFYLIKIKWLFYSFYRARYDEHALTAWNDSVIYASAQADISDSESEEYVGLPHEIPQPLFRDRDVNRSLDYDILNGC